MNINGKLKVGVLHDGVMLRDFSLRPRKIRDTIEVIEELEKQATGVRVEVAALARCLSMPGLPPELVTTDFVLDMHDEDHEVLIKAAADLVKKLKAGSEASALSA